MFPMRRDYAFSSTFSSVSPGVSALQFKSLFSHSMDVEWSTLDWASGPGPSSWFFPSQLSDLGKVPHPIQFPVWNKWAHQMPTKSFVHLQDPQTLPRPNSMHTSFWDLSNSRKLNLVTTVSSQRPPEWLPNIVTNLLLLGGNPSEFPGNSTQS